MRFGYAFDFDDVDQYFVNIPLSTGTETYDSPTAVYDTSTYANTGGFPYRVDMAGRGRVLRLTFTNTAMGETFKISGFGITVMPETVTS
jgi:hypothetical protein